MRWATSRRIHDTLWFVQGSSCQASPITAQPSFCHWRRTCHPCQAFPLGPVGLVADAQWIKGVVRVLACVVGHTQQLPLQTQQAYQAIEWAAWRS